MITIRKSQDRGHAEHGWLDSYHSFSFADFYDPKWMGFRSLRVINEDRVAAAQGFGSHPHRDMEIITYVVRGAVAHKDSTGSEGVVKRGDVQTMSAGAGVRHSEFNASQNEDLRLLQIWVMPQAEGIKPGYAQRHFPDSEKRNTLRLIAAPANENGALPIQQDVRLYASLLDAGKTVEHHLAKDRGAWVQIVDGAIDVNGVHMTSGDGAAIEDVETLQIKAQADSEFLLFDLV